MKRLDPFTGCSRASLCDSLASQCDRTPLYIAIEKGHHDVMKLLIEEYGADPEGKSIVRDLFYLFVVKSLI